MENNQPFTPQLRPEHVPKAWERGGPSPNPDGRPKGLTFTEAVRRAVDPRELVLQLLSMARGQTLRMTLASDGNGQPVFVQGEMPSVKDRVAAIKLLCSAWPNDALNPMQTGAAVRPGPDLDRMTPEQVSAYAQLVELMWSGAVDPTRLLAAARGR